MSLAIIVTLYGCANANGLGSLSEARFSQSELASLDPKIDMALVSLDGQPRLQVTVSLTMPRAQLGLSLPNNFLRKEKLYELIEHLSVSDGARVIDLAQPAIKILEAPVGKRVTYRYFVRHYSSRNEEKYGSFFAPIIHDNYIQYTASMAAIIPIGMRSRTPFNLAINWHMPENFKILNSYGAYKTHQEVSTNGEAFLDTFYIAGSDIRDYKKTVDGNPVIIAIQGDFENIKDEDFSNVLTELLKTQRESWSDNNYPYFLASIVALGTGCLPNEKTTFAGTAHVTSFRSYFPSRCPLSADMKQLISHELMHTWIGKIIQMGQDRGHIDGKWFTEGFTEYYGRIMAYRAKVISLQEYFSTFNRQLERYYISNQRFVTLRELVKRMYRKGFSNYFLEQVPYQQGEIMAWQLNKQIKSATNFSASLDNVIAEMLALAKAQGGYKNFSVNEFAELIERYSKNSLLFSQEYENIVNGKTVYPPDLPDCSDPVETQFTIFRGRYHLKIQEGVISYRTLHQNCAQWLQ
jgi:predicted metalloprotease with PDZ domain